MRRSFAAWIAIALVVAAQIPLRAATGDEARAACEALAAVRVDTPPDTVYSTFNRFCRAHFGAEQEPLVYAQFGDQPAFLPGGDWVHASVHSACIGWETSLPVDGRVAYGPTPACAAATAPEERPFYVHVQYLTGLVANATYHYRLVATDERGRTIESPVRTFVTAMPAGALELPGDRPGPPYVLDRAGATYVLTRDLVVPGKAIEIAANGITLDLNGHTVAYHNETVPESVFDDKWMSYVNKGAYGIRSAGCTNLAILNGTVREGAGVNSGNEDSEGFMPLYLRDAAKVTIAGLTVDYRSPQNTGMRLRTAHGDVDIHHCVFLDRGCRIVSRHGAAVRALSLMSREGTGYRVHHNLVKRTRQMGLLGADELDHNETYTDSWSVNSFCLDVWKENGAAWCNRVFGTGVNVQGFGWTDHDTVISNNLVHLQGINTGDNRGKEGWGDQDSMNGLRVTNYGKGGQPRNNLRYDRNLVIINCRGGSQARGTEFFSDVSITNLWLRNSTIKVLADDPQTSRIACVVTHGQTENADTCLPVFYENCRLISDTCNIRFGDYYGRGSNHQFLNCRFERAGTSTNYHTFAVDGYYWSRRHVLLDCTFGPGAAWDDVIWMHTAPSSFYSVAWTLALQTIPDAAVRVTDATGAVAFEGQAPASGRLEIPLTQCVVHPPKKFACPSTGKETDVRTPHTVAVTSGGVTKQAAVEMTGRREVTLR